MDINTISDPPFFPIARYQRQESIHKPASPDQKVGLATDQGFNTAAVKSEATTAAARAVSSSAVPQKGISPGAILSVKI